MHHNVPLTAVVGDTIFLFQLVHREYVGYPLWDVPYLHGSEFPLLVGLEIPRITVDLDSTGHGVNVLQVRRSLSSTHLDRLANPAAPLLGLCLHERTDVWFVPPVRLLRPSPPLSCEAELVVLLPVLGICLPSDLRRRNGSNGSLPHCSSAY